MIGIIISLCLMIIIATIAIYRAIDSGEVSDLGLLAWLIIPAMLFTFSALIRNDKCFRYERLITTKAITEAKLEAFYKAYPEYERTFENNEKTIKEENVNNLKIEY